MASTVPRYRRPRVAPNEPRFVIRRSAKPGGVLGFAYVEAWAGRQAVKPGLGCGAGRASWAGEISVDMVPGSLAVHWGGARQLCGSVSCSYLCLCTGLERTRFGEPLDRFDLCVVLGDALGCQMWIVEARSHDDGDTLDCSGFHVVDAVCVRTKIACQPDDRWRDSLNRHGCLSICLSHAASRGRMHPRVPDWGDGVHEKPMLSPFSCTNAHHSV